MAQATGSRHSVSYVAETVFNTTPATPSMLELRHTSCNLAVEKDQFESEEIRGDRQIDDHRHGARRGNGPIGAELSHNAYDDFLEAGLGGTWTTNVLKAGTTFKSFTIERAFNDITKYQPYTGCVIDTIDLTIPVDGMVTAEFGIVGSGSMTPSDTPLDADITAAASNPPFDGFTGSLSEGGSGANCTSLTLNLNNNLFATYVIGTNVAHGINLGRSNLTGEATFLFESETLLNKFLQETESSIQAVLTDPSSNSLTIDIPRLKYTAGTLDVTTADEGIVVVMPFQALRDGTEETNLKLTRSA